MLARHVPELIAFALLASGSLFAILSPFGTVPTFLALTEGAYDAERISMARRACIVAFAVLMAFSLVGSQILGLFQVGVPALQMAGGIVILRVGLEMLGGTRRRLTPEERAEAIEKDDIAITPLAIPMLCGPGAITTAIVLESQAPGLAGRLVLVAVVGVVYLATFGTLWLAVRYSAVLGQITIRVIGRLMGLLLAAIAVQFLVNGLRAIFPSLVAT